MMETSILRAVSFQKKICQLNRNMMSIQNKLVQEYLLIEETVSKKTIN